MAATGGIGIASIFSGVAPLILSASDASADGKPAILGGTPYNQGAYTHWPVIQDGTEEKLLEVFRTGNWFRGYSADSGIVSEFEKAFAAVNGAKHCLGVSSGTGALITSMAAFDVGPGDEVITSPYTFIATINSILSHFALPVPVDVDLDTFQLSAAAAEKAIGPNTRCLMPVHIGGSPADLDAFLDIGKRRGLPVIEDACQAHFGCWRGKSLGSFGTTGCFSMQVSKNLSSGEGGAILTNDDALAEKLHKCHNNCRGKTTGSFDFSYGVMRAVNYRMAGMQAAILLGQMKGVEKNADIRQENGVYLNRLLADIPGVVPAKFYPGVTRGAWHLYMFRLDQEGFGLSREKFMQALNAERIPCSAGYGAVDWVDFSRKTFATKAGERIYPKRMFDDLTERIGALSNFKRLAAESVWFTQNMLLGPKSNMDIIADAIRRIQKNAADIAKA